MTNAASQAPVEASRYRSLPAAWAGLLILVTMGAIFLALNQVLNLGFFVGKTLLDSSYLYALAALLTGTVFLIIPASSRAPRDRVPWYDAAMFLALAAVFAYFAWNGQRIVEEAWEFSAPDTAVWVAAVGWLLLLEATRRGGGLTVAIVVALFSFYPIFAEVMPGPISGLGQDLRTTIGFHFASSESVMGIPMRAFGELVIGFVMFGAALQYTGAAHFFNNLALALFGAVRGGPAKVAIFASGLMGSVSGSVVSNVLTTGVVTIPAMKRTGFSPAYAGGVEACASTGGVLMPPVMGATAFIMASFLGKPYAAIAIAATIPSLLYYFALFIQIDGYAARNGLKGLPREELPSIRKTFAEGWHYIFVFVLLVWMLLVLQREALAPFYATALLLVINQFSKQYRLDRARLGKLVLGIGAALAELAALLAGVGMIIGALSVTGLAGTLANDLVYMAGNNVYVLLVMGALTSFIFGMGMTITACYIFLAIVLAPPLVAAGFDPVAVHLFMLYWGMVSFITPPVSLAAFVAAGVAGAAPIKVGMQSMRLGSIMYIVPFFFVLNPALIMRGEAWEIATVVATAIVGIMLLAAALEGYLTGFGSLRGSFAGMVGRLLLAAGGITLALPGGGDLELSHLQLSLVGIVIAVVGVAIARLGARAPARA
ncbi:TRAP transporter fused permease subunit [Burkholderiaceae bacterium FT117]|uniref:TRAP transporter permease n=1 Tax=Zeimonas sediminis TaxID=2944268 RepID=UPI002342E637|nr:TRAP transporter fused permease subunit [Zeimonas sediminis]MCM5569580.1 TRAP transporter fused permease subunit [Zeimonas sediminis]